MITLTESFSGHIVGLSEGSGGNRHWYVYPHFIFVISEFLNMGGRSQSHHAYINTGNGNSVYLTIDELRQLNKARKGSLTLAQSQLDEMRTRLGIEWEPIYPSYVEDYHKYGFTRDYKIYSQVNPGPYLEKWQKDHEVKPNADVPVPVSES